MALYINGTNCKQFNVVLDTSEPDMTWPYYAVQRRQVRDRLIDQFVPQRNITTGDMLLKITGVYNTNQAKEEFEAFLRETFTTRINKKVVEIILPSDSETIYLTTLSGHIAVKNINKTYHAVNGNKIIKEYEIPLTIELIKKKVIRKVSENVSGQGFIFTYDGLKPDLNYVVEVRVPAKSKHILTGTTTVIGQNNDAIFTTGAHTDSRDDFIIVDPINQTIKGEQTNRVYIHLKNQIPIVTGVTGLIYIIADGVKEEGIEYTLWEVF